MSKYKPKRLLKEAKRILALVLCASMWIPLVAFAMPARAVGDSSAPSFDDLYIRQADKNTMDSYVQASLGGFIYKDRDIGGVTSPTIRNNFGTRYAGEVWADLSVFARGQNVMADIRPYEAANAAVPAGYHYTGDGDFNGETLTLERHTDGVNSSVTMTEDADFLNVFSVLGSSQRVVDKGPFDVVFVVDVSASMENPEVPDSKIFQTVEALNASIEELMSSHPDNRVGLVVFASRPYELMELGRYQTFTTADGEEVYVEATDPIDLAPSPFNPRIDRCVFTISASAIGETDDKETVNNKKSISTGDGAYGTYGDSDWLSIGEATSIDLGLWTGMSMLAERPAEDLIVEIEGKLVCRVPSLVVLSDGEPTLFTPEDASFSIAQAGWELPRKITGDNFMLGSGFPFNLASLPSQSAEHRAAILLGTLFRGSLMKAAVTKHYQAAAKAGLNGTPAENADSVQFGIYTIGVELSGVDLPFSARAALDPNNAETGFNSSNADYGVQLAYNDWIALREGRILPISHYIFTSTQENGVYGYRQRLVDFTSFPANGVTLPYGNADKGISVSRNEFNAVMDEGYADRYFDVKDASTLDDIFQTVMTLIETAPYKPVGGTNDAGVSDSMTYTNPLGKYMTVNDVTDVTLFGEHYKVSKYAVYDPEHTVSQDGWYDTSGNLVNDNGLPGDYADAGAAWDAGYEYRITQATAGRLIPTANSAQPEKLSSTVYTVYRITGQYVRPYEDTPAANDPYGNRWTVNKSMTSIPVLDGDTPEAVKSRTRSNLSYAYSEGGGGDVTFDLLDDIKIWVEDTGDYRDPDSGNFVVDAGYDMALFVNIGVEAMPVQMATVIRNLDVNRVPYPDQYTTNLNDTWASTPLRVYYDVSIDPDYLRYDDEGNVVGVAMSDISPEYFKENTATVGIEEGQFIVNGVEGVEDGQRYTAFYTNYFSNSIYNDYPVMDSEFDVSRGNTAVTFAVDADNQFYRFQKNRVLFLIPGSYGSDTRPVEIDMGNLKDIWVDEEGNAIKSTNNPGLGYHPCDPDNYVDLLAALNIHRGDMNWDGSNKTSMFWEYGDCVPVDGGADLTLTDQPQIDSNNWYYIVREFYSPSFDSGESGTTDNVDIHYIAIARKGSEFGSGVAGGGRDNMGAMIQWYHPGEISGSNTAAFENSGNYGRPAGDGWYVSAKPGGLRVGGMSSFVGTKGYDIREGVDQAGFTKKADVIARANITQRALTYFLPTVSSFEEVQDPATEGANINVVINLYMGNNGRILVNVNLLPVTINLDATKMVEDKSEDQTAPELNAGQYSFSIIPADSNPDPDPIAEKTVTNGAPDDPNRPDEINPALVKLIENAEYTKAGTYIYYVREVQPGTAESGIPGISYDTKTRTVTVLIEEEYDNSGNYTGRLTATVTVDGKAVESNPVIFKNTYDPSSITITLESFKTFVGGSLKEERFDFELTGISAEYEEDDGDRLPPPPGGPDATWAYSRGNGPAIGLPANSDKNPDEVEKEPGEEFENPEEEPDNLETPDDSKGSEDSDDPDSEPEEPEEELDDNNMGNGDNGGITNPEAPDGPDCEPDSSKELDESKEAEDPDDPDDEPTARIEDLEHGVPVISARASYPSDMAVIRGSEETNEIMPLDEETPNPDSVSVSNDANGVISFGEITLTEEGTYTYEIRELPGNRSDVEYDETVYIVTVVVVKDTATGALQATVTIAVKDGTGPVDKIEFKNAARVGGLSVSKTVVNGNAADNSKEFHFTVTLSDTSINGTYGDMTFVDGVAEITLKNGETKEATELPAGIIYKVVEEEADQGEYTTTATGDTGAIQANTTAEAMFVNSKSGGGSAPDPEPGRGDLTVTKTVSGSDGDREKEFHFTVTLSNRNINGNYGDVTFVNGEASFTLKHGESKTIRNLPEGVTYTVTEAEANEDGYTTSASGESGTITDGGQSLASFINDKSNNSPNKPTDPEDPAEPSDPGTPDSPTPPDKPSTPDNVPQTGDESNMVLWFSIMLASGVALVALVRKTRKGKRASE